MEKILSQQDIDNINILIRITKAIDNLYWKLHKLELYNQKDSLEYQKLLDNLRIAIETENDKYSELNLTYERCEAILAYIEREKVPGEFSNDITSVVAEDYNNRIYRRIRQVIIRKVMLNYSEDFILSEAKDILKVLEKISTEPNAKTQTKWQTNLGEAFTIDFYSLYLYFINKEILTTTDTIIKERLLASKYNLAFIDKDVEESLLKTGFTIKSPLYFYMNDCKSFLDIPDFYYALYLKDLSQRYISASINGLISLPGSSEEISLSDMYKIKVMQIIMTSLLRSSFVISDEETLEEMNYSFNESLEDEEFAKSLDKHGIGIDIVKNAFLNIKSDKAEIARGMLADDFKK